MFLCYNIEYDKARQKGPGFCCLSLWQAVFWPAGGADDKAAGYGRGTYISGGFIWWI